MKNKFIKDFKSFVNESFENMKVKGKYYVDTLEGTTFDGNDYGSDDYGVFSIDNGDHCYFYGSKKDCDQFCDEKNWEDLDEPQDWEDDEFNGDSDDEYGFDTGSDVNSSTPDWE
jgi:hypothetical protein